MSPDVETFDVEAWAAGTTRVIRSVEVFGKPHLQGEIEALDARLTAETKQDEAQALAEQIRALQAEMDASRRVFKFQSLSQADVDAVHDAMDGREDDYEEGMRLLAAQCVEPKGATWQTFAKMQEGLQSYFSATIVRTAVMARDGLGVTVPFSQSALLIRGTTD